MAGETTAVPAWKLALWTVLFQLAWHWNGLADLLRQGVVSDNDDYQRLAEVRAFMGGQGWFDLVNHRMDPPFGALMHWSRLVDVPIAALAWLFGLVAEPVPAERLAMLVWPTLLIVALVLVMVALTKRLEPRAPALLVLLLTVTCSLFMAEFAPGRIDHHNVQIVALALMLLALVSPVGLASRAGLGAAAALSITVGLDGLLPIAVLFGWLVIEWSTGRDRDGRGLTGCALGLALAAPALHLVSFPPSLWLDPACDAASAVWLTALLLAAGVMAALALAGRRLGALREGGWLPRLALAGGLGLAALGLLLALYPHCAGGPYGLVDPELKRRWMDDVVEAMGALTLAGAMPSTSLRVIGFALAMLAASLVVAWRYGRTKPAVLTLLACYGAMVALSLLQVRVLRIGAVAAIPLCALFVMLAVDRARRMVAQGGLARLRGPALQAAAFLLVFGPSWLLPAVALWPDETLRGPASGAVSAAQAAPSDEPAAPTAAPAAALSCWAQDSFAALAARPRGLVANHVDAGAATVIHTHHDVIGGPYHRNGPALLDMLDIFSGPDATARAILARRKADYLALCARVLEEADPPPGSLGQALASGAVPDWLEPIGDPAGPLRAFRIRRERL